MKKIHLTLLALVILTPSFAQTPKKEILEQINKDIWIPFITGVNTNNAQLYNGVHSKDFYWVRAGEKTRIMNFQEYVDDARIVMEGRAGKNIKTELEIRFLERNVNTEFASEKCVIKYTSTEPGKAPQTSYGITQVFSRHEATGWKKTIQYVHTEAVSEDVYARAEVMN